MAPITSLEDLIAQIRQNPELREQLLSVLLTQELLSLPAEFREFRAEMQAITLEHQRRLNAIEAQIVQLRLDFEAQFQAQREEFNQQIQASRKEVNEQIEALRQEVNQQIAELRKEVYEQIAELRKEVNEQIEALRQEVNQQIAELRKEVNEQIEALRQEVNQQIAELRKEVYEQIAELRTEMYEQFRIVFARLDKHEQDIGKLKGDMQELLYMKRAKSIFGRYLRPVNPYEPGEFCEKLEAQMEIPEELRNQILNLDMVVQGLRRTDREEVVIAVEVSYVIDMNDVMRAHHRARAIQQLGLKALGSACGVEIIPEARELAQELGVLIIYDGTAEGAEFLNAVS